MNKDKILLKEAACTIKDTRRENEMLRARLSGFEDAMLLLKTQPSWGGQGLMSPDIVYDLEKRVEEISMEEDATPKTVREK